MTAHGDWEGSEAPRHPRAWLAVGVVAALAVGLVLGRGGDRPPDPAELVIEEATRAPEQPTFDMVQTVPAVNGAWRRLPAAPLRGRTAAPATWTGSDVLVWGGRGAKQYRDGALYDPLADTWRLVAPSPLRARWRHAAVWDGDEVVIAGGVAEHDRQGAKELHDVAAYNPATDRWRRLPPVPFAVFDGRLFASDGRLYAVSRTARQRPVAVLDAGAAMWRLLTPAPITNGGETVVGATETALVLWPPARGDAVALDLRTRTWSQLAHGEAPRSLLDCRCVLVGGTAPRGSAELIAHDTRAGRWWRQRMEPIRPTFVGDGSALLYLVQSPGTVVAVDRDTGSILRLPAPPHDLAFEPVTGWTGGALFLWSGVNPLKSRYAADGAVFVPGGLRGPRAPGIF